MDCHPDADSASTHTQSTTVVDDWVIHSRLAECNRLQREVPIDVLALPPGDSTQACSSDAQQMIFVKQHFLGNPLIEDLHPSGSVRWARVRVEVPLELSKSERKPSVDVFSIRQRAMNARSKLNPDVPYLYFSFHTRSGLGDAGGTSLGEESISLDDGEIYCSFRTRQNMDDWELQNLGQVPFLASTLPVSGAQADICPGSSIFLFPGCWRIQAGHKFIEVKIEAARRLDQQKTRKGWIGSVFEYPFHCLRKVVQGFER